jgi:hypothetical protein
MKKIILIVFLSLLFLPKPAIAQYWDWVTDAKSMEAFTENYGYQLEKLYEYLGYWEVIQANQDTIAQKATFIHMVRDSLFKSLQDASRIDGGKDEDKIREVFNEIGTYYSAIRDYTSKNSDFKGTWDNYDKYVTDYSRDLLAMADMATAGNNEKNLLDKNQRLYLLAYVLKEMRQLKAVSQRTYHILFTVDNMREAQKKVSR